MKYRMPSASDYNQQKAKERKAGLAGDKKPQTSRRMPLVGGSVSIKNSCLKSREAGCWLESGEYGKPAGGGKGRRGRRQWFII